MGASKELDTVDRIVSPNIGRIHRHLVGRTLHVVSRDTWRHCLGSVPTCRCCPTSGPCNWPGGATPHLDRTLPSVFHHTSTSARHRLHRYIGISLSSASLGLRNSSISFLCGDGIRSCIISGAHPNLSPHVQVQSPLHPGDACCVQSNPFYNFLPKICTASAVAATEFIGIRTLMRALYNAITTSCTEK